MTLYQWALWVTLGATLLVLSVAYLLYKACRLPEHYLDIKAIREEEAVWRAKAWGGRCEDKQHGCQCDQR